MTSLLLQPRLCCTDRKGKRELREEENKWAKTERTINAQTTLTFSNKPSAIATRMETGKEKVVDVSPEGKLTVRQAATAGQVRARVVGGESLNKEFFQQGLAADTEATGAARDSISSSVYL